MAATQQRAPADEPRFLRPARLLAATAGVWVVDAFQPVAALIDPARGTIDHLTSWSNVVPSAIDPFAFEPSGIAAAGMSLWVQQERGAPVVRLGDSDEPPLPVSVPHGFRLVAADADACWCLPPAPEQIVIPDGSPVVLDLVEGSVLRIANDGDSRWIRAEGPIHALVCQADVLSIEVGTREFALRPLGAGHSEVTPRTRWLTTDTRRVPSLLTWADHGVAGSERIQGLEAVAASIEAASPWHNASNPGLLGGQFRWVWGWGDYREQPRGRGKRRILLTAHDVRKGDVVRSWDLGEGYVQDAVVAGGRFFIAIARRWAQPADPTQPAEVIRLDGAQSEPVVIIGASQVDITGRGWPLIGPPAALDEYLSDVLQEHSEEEFWRMAGRPLVMGLTHAETTLRGVWPEAQLELTFGLEHYPGVMLRRHLRLFDELGRPDPPVEAWLHLQEDVDSGNIPGPESAERGVLEI